VGNFNIHLKSEAANQFGKMDGCWVISKHFPSEDVLDYPIETLPFTSRWLFQVPGSNTLPSSKNS